MIKRYLLAALMMISSAIYVGGPAFACSSVSDCQAEESKYQGLIDQSKNQENTLRGQINYFDNQIALAQAQVDEKQAELDQLAGSIADLNGQITDLQSQLDNLTKVAIKRIRFSEASTKAAPMEAQAVTGDFTDSISNYAYQKFIQYKDVQILKQLLDLKTQLAQHKTDLQTQQTKVQQTRDQLAQARSNLDNQRWAKASLLAQTRNSEANYQALLASAKDQEQTFKAFANARIGSGSYLLSSPDVYSDRWGQYYNQRDPRWGSMVVVGDSDPTDTVAALGCLITSVAMVWTHYGGNDATNPEYISQTQSYFVYGTPGMWYTAAPPPNHSVSYQEYPSVNSIINHVNDSNHDPVIIGLGSGWDPIRKYWRFTHWVVVRGVQNGQLMINDPWEQDAYNVPLNNNYSGWTIFGGRFYQ